MTDPYVNYSTIANLKNKPSDWQLKTIEVEKALLDYFTKAYGLEMLEPFQIETELDRQLEDPFTSWIVLYRILAQTPEGILGYKVRHLLYLSAKEAEIKKYDLLLEINGVMILVFDWEVGKEEQEKKTYQFESTEEIRQWLQQYPEDHKEVKQPFSTYKELAQWLIETKKQIINRLKYD